MKAFRMRALASKAIPIIRYIGYLIGLSLLIYQAYNGVLAIRQGKAIIPGLGASLLALVFSILAMACQIIAWWLMMKGLQPIRIPLKEIFWGYTLSFLPRYIPGTIWGYMSRGDWLKTDYSINYKTSTLGSAIELVLMVIVNIILSSLILLSGLTSKMIFLIILLILFVLIILISQRGIRIFISDLVKSVRFIYVFAALAMLFCTWIFYGFGLFIVAEPSKALHFMGYDKLFLYVSIYSAAWLIGFFVLFVPAGMGVRELALSRFLTTYAIFDAQSANGLAVFFRLVVTISELSWLILGWAVKKLFSSRAVISKISQL